MEETINSLEEQNYRINIKQTSKGFAYFDVTCRAEKLDELKDRLDRAIEIAVIKCEQINQVTAKKRAGGDSN
jgi:hypothetical protein